MTPVDAVAWMLQQLIRDGCLYQDDVVDHLVRAKAENLIRENSDGNLAIAEALLKAFENATRDNVVWVRADFYWRYRVPEDEEGRVARG